MKKWERREFYEFIEKAKEVCRDCGFEDSSEKYKAKKREYFKTEKGKAAKQRGYLKRQLNKKLSEKDLSFEEKQLIGQFYKNCPEGYEVDHIHPISKGGKHRLSNLQYLTRADNMRKYDKIEWKPEPILLILT